MASPSLDEFLSRVNRGHQPLRDLNPREMEVVETALQQAGQDSSLRDIVIDIAKSSTRAPWSEGSVPCIVPNSRPWRALEKRELTLTEVVAEVGLGRYVKETSVLTRF